MLDKFSKLILVMLIVAAGQFGEAKLRNALGATLVDTGADPNLLPPFPPGGFSPWAFGTDRALAAKFSLGSAQEITAIHAFISASNSPNLSLEIWSDSGNLPSASLFSQAFAVANHAAGWEAFSGLSWTLNSGDYWVLLIGNSCLFDFCGSWWGEAPNPLSRHASSENRGAGPWVVLPQPSGNLSLRIFGDPAPELSSVPLPASLPLFATGLGALGFLRWLRNRRQSRSQ